jgi:hypothetical protein
MEPTTTSAVIASKGCAGSPIKVVADVAPNMAPMVERLSFIVSPGSVAVSW